MQPFAPTAEVAGAEAAAEAVRTGAPALTGATVGVTATGNAGVKPAGRPSGTGPEDEAGTANATKGPVLHELMVPYLASGRPLNDSWKALSLGRRTTPGDVVWL